MRMEREGKISLYCLPRDASWPGPGEGVIYKYANHFYAQDSNREVTRSGVIR